MIAILSPSKTLNEDTKLVTNEYTVPDFPDRSRELVETLRDYSTKDLEKLMSINPKLAELNVERYMQWNTPFKTETAKPALLMFKGEVYNGLRADELNEKDLLFAQDHVRILSGLYGILRPLDLIMPYRLEMGTKLKTGKGNDLYEFWGNQLTEKLNEAFHDHKEKVLINLASNEYVKALNTDELKVRIINIQFKEEREGTYKFITVYGKNARGLMTRFMIRNRIEIADDLKSFDLDGYFLNQELSKEDDWVFTR